MNKNDFTSFAKRHFAQKLNIDENKVEELYEFVNTHFAIEVTDNQFCSPNKQLRYTATLVYEEPGDYGRDMQLMSFGNKELGGEGAFYDEFPTKEAALQAAYQCVNSVEFTSHNWVLSHDKPLNLLILFDKDYKKQSK